MLASVMILSKILVKICGHCFTGQHCLGMGLNATTSMSLRDLKLSRSRFILNLLCCNAQVQVYL